MYGSSEAGRPGRSTQFPRSFTQFGRDMITCLYARYAPQVEPIWTTSGNPRERSAGFRPLIRPNASSQVMNLTRMLMLVPSANCCRAFRVEVWLVPTAALGTANAGFHDRSCIFSTGSVVFSTVTCGVENSLLKASTRLPISSPGAISPGPAFSAGMIQRVTGSAALASDTHVMIDDNNHADVLIVFSTTKIRRHSPDHCAIHGFPHPHPIDQHGLRKSRCRIGVSRPIAAHRQIQQQEEGLIEHPLPPGRQGRRSDLRIRDSVEKELDRARQPLDAKDVKKVRLSFV